MSVGAMTLVFDWPIELDPESQLADVLGRPNFWCGPIAHIYQRAGAPIATKAEREQAFIIHRMVLFIASHGPEGWADAMNEEIDQLVEHIKHAEVAHV